MGIFERKDLPKHELVQKLQKSVQDIQKTVLEKMVVFSGSKCWSENKPLRNPTFDPSKLFEMLNYQLYCHFSYVNLIFLLKNINLFKDL